MAARNPFASSIPDIYDAYAPYSYQRKPLSTGYYFVRNLLIVGALCGGFVALYRNDVLRDLARRVGQEPRYLAAEQEFLAQAAILVDFEHVDGDMLRGEALDPIEGFAPGGFGLAREAGDEIDVDRADAGIA